MAEDVTGAQEKRTAPHVQAGVSFLARASRLLASSLDYENALVTVTDMGLATSRRLAHMLDGELAVGSTPGGASIFSLHLPHGKRRVRLRSRP